MPGRATLVDITAGARAGRLQARRSSHDGLVELLDTLAADDQATHTWRCAGRSGMEMVISVPGDVERTSNCPPDASTLVRIDAIPI